MSALSIVLGVALGLVAGTTGLVLYLRRARRESLRITVPTGEPCPVVGCTGHPPSVITTLAQPEDARNFCKGMDLVWPLGEDAPRRPRWRDRVRRFVWWALWWRQIRYEITAVDVASGQVTQERLRWSWRRWRWEIEPQYTFRAGDPGQCLEGMERFLLLETPDLARRRRRRWGRDS